MQEKLDINNNLYSTDLLTFASQIVWFMKPKEVVEDKNLFLLHIMARQSDLAYLHAKKYFAYKDDDFRTALYNADSGIIIIEEIWDLWNTRLNINPPLEMPQKKWLHEMTEEEIQQKYGAV